MSNSLIVFISYSWSSEEYKAKVLELAKDLTDNGVDVILDRWDLSVGQDKFAFMEQSIEKADKVLILCDKMYVKKADIREGGVGTETMIITPEVYTRCNQEKFIPVIMENFEVVPTYLEGRMGINFMDGHREQGFEEILRVIYNQPVNKKPPIGRPPEWLTQPKKGLEHQGCKNTSTFDINVNSKETSMKLVNCDPAKSPTFIAALFGFGSSMLLIVSIMRVLMPQFYFWWQLFVGLICLTGAVILALPYFKQPLEVGPYFQSHPKLLAFVSGGMKLCVFILEFAKPFRIIVIIMALVMILFKRFLF